MGRLFLSAIPHRARTLYHVRYRVVIVFFIVTLLQQHHLYLVSRQSLSEKYSATNFDARSGDLQPRYWGPDDEDSQFQHKLLANREDWKLLGEGFEGKVFAYQDSVIKTFIPGRSPFRNCAPNSATRWPTEIPASLRFGGSSPIDYVGDEASNDTKPAYTGFLPVKAHFMASTSSGHPEEWHLVTPLVTGGTLVSLAETHSTEQKAKSYREIDALYRPAFNSLLDSMATFHDAGYCHDDIKPSNVFIQDGSQWVIGDLGNVREISHPYHSSRIWKENQQLADCRANDVVRALQSYLKFIQSCMADHGAFNTALFESEEPTSKLLWWTLADAPGMRAEQLRQRSIIEHPGAAPELENEERFPAPAQPHTLLRIFSKRAATKLAAEHVLMTRMDERSARLWGLVWLFGVPDSGHCGV